MSATTEKDPKLHEMSFSKGSLKKIVYDVLEENVDEKLKKVNDIDCFDIIQTKHVE